MAHDDKSTSCDTTVALIGTPYTATCLDCDWAYQVVGEVTDEKGTGCNYDRFAQYGTFLPTEDMPDRWIGFSYAVDLGTYFSYNWLWAGYDIAGKTTKPIWGSRLYGETSYFGTAVAKAGALEWHMEYESWYEYKPYTDCGTSSGSYLSASMGGSYVGYGTLACDYYPTYDRWDFTGTSYDNAYISVDTTSDFFAFDPTIYIMDSSTCLLGMAFDSFDCSYRGAGWPSTTVCPSYELPMTPGELYSVIVKPEPSGFSVSTTCDYRISLDTPSDPKLTAGALSVPVYDIQHVSVDGVGTIP